MIDCGVRACVRAAGVGVSFPATRGVVVSLWRPPQLREAIAKIWVPLAEKQAKVREERDKLKMAAAEQKERVLEEEYIVQRLRRTAALQDNRIIKTARNTNIRVNIGGLTARAPPSQPFRGGMVRNVLPVPPGRIQRVASCW